VPLRRPCSSLVAGLPISYVSLSQLSRRSRAAAALSCPVEVNGSGTSGTRRVRPRDPHRGPATHVALRRVRLRGLSDQQPHSGDLGGPGSSAQDKPGGVALAATFGLPLYVNSDASLPLVKSFLDSGASAGAAMAFFDHRRRDVRRGRRRGSHRLHGGECSRWSSRRSGSERSFQATSLTPLPRASCTELRSREWRNRRWLTSKAVFS